MKDFVILKTKDNIFPYICIVQTVEDVSLLKEELLKEMKTRNINNLLVDLLFTNGFSNNRFCTFSKENFKMVNSDSINLAVYNFSCNYFKNNPNLLRMSALSNSTIYKVLNT